MFFFLLAFFLMAGVVSLFYIPKFRVNSVKAEGNEILSSGSISSRAEEIIGGKYFYILPKNNIFIIPEEEIKTALSQDFLRIKNILIFSDLPASLTVQIEERKPFALLCKKEILECAFLDENGFIFERAPFFSGRVFMKFFYDNNIGDLPIGKDLISREEFLRIKEFAVLVSKKDVEITEIILKEDGICDLRTSEGWFMKVSKEDDQKIVFENLKLTLENQIKDKRSDLEYIDLRLNNKVFFKFK